jgi:predicted AAA+ superfamily ATPase
MEFLKYRLNKGKKNNLNFYRDSTGNEVDIIYNVAQKMLAVEVKAGATISGEYFKGLRAFDKVAGADVFARAIVYGGDRNEYRSEVHITNYFNVKSLLDGFNLE